MNLTVTCIGMLATHRVLRFELENQHQMRLAVLNYGGLMEEMSVLEHKGNLLLTPPELPQLIKQKGYANHLIGRVAGVIENSCFMTADRWWNLPTNYYQHTLNGGPNGFDHQFFDVEPQPELGMLTLHYWATERTDGFPGNVVVSISYQLTADDCVHVTFKAQQLERDGIFDPTLKTVFAVASAATADLLRPQVLVNGHQRLVIDEVGIAKGLVVDEVTKGPQLGHQINIPVVGHSATYIVPADLTQLAAQITDPVSQHQIQIFSNRPGLYVASSRQTGTEQQGINGLTIMAQSLPNSVNIPEFGSISIAVNATKRYDIIYEYIKIN
ncbi:hypothetical protein KAR50_00920 [Periweissella fabaria]|uniref:Maltose epimerase n=1 Tax=Periweissella fabaria TaxID=546157 RepID=A0ABN8BJ33_9LACO|nr:hypothetical protein [Periweissella fabaria]MCM0596407.1 hypothetical protein [Periweissella fabaria]CAH0415865.1 Maltose epimerase [Periweissella fabaria]